MKENYLFSKTHLLRILTLGVLIITIPNPVLAQFDSNGCVGANFGIDAGLYSGTIEFGNGTPAINTLDWFQGATGDGIINESQSASLYTLLQSGNPIYEVRMNAGLSSIINGQIRIDAVWARDVFGGTGYMDNTAYTSSSKNGQDPAIWATGTSNVLGKNDLIDVAGHMFRDGTGNTDNLWFVGMINRAEPGGTAYMSFEFYVKDITFTPGSGFSSGGPQLGHTAFNFDVNGEITKVGDFIFNVSLINGGVDAVVELRLWVSYTDYLAGNSPAGFNWGTEFDGAFNGSPYGYANVVPVSQDACGIVNLENQNPSAPPWGTLGTKKNIFTTSYLDYSVVEVGINMTAFGLDHASLNGSDPCLFPLNTFLVKSRTSASFTSSLKDFAGPYTWGQPVNTSVIAGDPLIACDNPIVTLTVNPNRADVTYTWSTVDGNIISNPVNDTILVDQPGTYTLTSLLPTGCPIPNTSIVVAFDPLKPFFNEPTATTTTACNGNDGTINLTVTGGTAPYTFLWSNGSTAEDPTGLTPGNYSVTITDAILCNITSGTFNVKAKTPTSISGVLTHVGCNGKSTGAINASVTGYPPYTYLWSNGSSLEDIAGLSAGNYTLTATDAEGCETSQTFTITEPNALVLSVVKTNETVSSLDDGTITMSIAGGTPSFLIDWDNDGTGDNDDSQNLSGLAAGTYTAIVTDSKGCMATISATILQPEICNDGIDNDGDGLTDCFDSECTPANPGSISASLNPVCVGDVGVTYSISAVPGADSYSWTVPAGASITAGQGTTTITVEWVSIIGGQICVKAVANGCKSAASSCFTVLVNDVPPIPGPINNN